MTKNTNRSISKAATRCIAAILCIGTIFCSCSKDSPDPKKEPLPLRASLGRVVTLDSELGLGSSATYSWSVTSAPSQTINEKTTTNLYSLTGANEEKPKFVAAITGEYTLEVKATQGSQVHTRTIVVSVTTPDGVAAPSPFVAKVIDYNPAPGQFTNVIPTYADGDKKENLIAKASEYLVGKKNGSLVHLGTFGGYIIVAFDHTIANVQGKRDFRVMGNAFWAAANPNPDAPKRGGSCEPGIIMVAHDANGNGRPDEDEWYEIAGSEYYKETTIKNYEITYYKPETEEPDPDKSGFTVIKNYIKWKDNQGGEGYHIKNMYHNQSYYPQWITTDSYSFKGTLLPKNAVEESGTGTYWVQYAYGYGYADNVPNNDPDSAIDISWAVNSKGEKVMLPGIEFVKIYTGLLQECGWLGETSTEIAGVYDLHLMGEDIDTVK